jgi:hypothetical protein
MMFTQLLRPACPGCIAPALTILGILLSAPPVMFAESATSTPTVVIDHGNQVTSHDIWLFNQRWMLEGDRSQRLGNWAWGLKNRQGWIAWGVADDANAMVHMYELTHDRQYLDYLRDMAKIVLSFRNDKHPGDDFPKGDNPVCMDCRPPFIDHERGKVEAAWNSATHWDWVADGGLTPVDAVLSGIYSQVLSAFARIVAEDPDPSIQTGYGSDAVTFANEALRTVWVFEPGFETRPAGDFVEGTFHRPSIFPTAGQCEQSRDLAADHARKFAKVDGKEPTDVLQKIDQSMTSNCMRAGLYAGKPEAHNQSGMLISMMIELWRALDSNFYRSSANQSRDADFARGLIPLMVARHQRYFVNRLHIEQNAGQGDRYWWHYNDDVPDPHVEDGHANLDMLNVEVLRRGFDRLNPMAAAFGEPIALDDAMRQRFANTFLEEIGRPTEIDNGGDLRFDVGGRSNGDVDRPSDNSNSQFDGWVNLASVEPTIYRICSEVGLRIRGANNSQPYLTIADHAALLANKQFAPQIVIVPNVLGLQKDEAIAAMKSVGLIPGAIALDNRCIDLQGTVLAQNPSAGRFFLLPGASFNLTVSSGRNSMGKPCVFQ